MLLVTTITFVATIEQHPISELYNLTVTPTTPLIGTRYWHKFALDDIVDADLSNISAILNIPLRELWTKWTRMVGERKANLHHGRCQPSQK